MTEFLVEAKKVAWWPEHKQIPWRIENMHEGRDKKGPQTVDPYYWVKDISESQLQNFTT